MSEPEETLFELDVDQEIVKTIGILLDAPIDKMKIYVNGIDINRTMKITTLKIVKVL